MSFEKTLDILFDDSGSLRQLARKSGLDVFSFFQGADLRGVDLSFQDLTGLNFEKADLRAANLNEVRYDAGAFNGSILSPMAESLKDEFEFYVEDIDVIWRRGLYFFGRFRPESLEVSINLAKLTYGRFSEISNINLLTLRKARRGQVVSGETVYRICQALRDGWHARFSSERYQRDLFDGASFAAVKQPFIELLNLKNGGQFSKIPRIIVLQVLEENPFWLKELFDPDVQQMRYNFDTMILFKDISERNSGRR